MDPVKNFAPLMGRILLAAFFIPYGWSKIGGFAGTVAYATSAGLPMPTVGVAIAIAIELLGGIAILIGWQTRIAAALLALFTLVASFYFHAYWALPADQQMLQSLMFKKNIAITGGLLLLVGWGAGAFSLDGRRKGA